MPAVASALTCLKRLSLPVVCVQCQNLSFSEFEVCSLIILFFLFIFIFDRIDQHNQDARRHRPAFAKLCMSCFSQAEHQVPSIGNLLHSRARRHSNQQQVEFQRKP